MKFHSISGRVALTLLFITAMCSPVIAAEDSAPPPTPYEVDLKVLAGRIGAKIRANQSRAAELAPELAEYDVLLAKYGGQPEAEAAIVVDRAFFTLSVLKDEDAAKALYEAVQNNYPGTKEAERAAKTLAQLTPEAKARRAAKRAERQAKLAALPGSEAPEIDFAWSSRAGLKKLADLRGQVVVLDFWATWCGPCIRSFPKVRAEVAHFAESPVVILGVTSLQGKVHGLEAKPIDTKDQPEKEYALTAEFIKKYEMNWPVAFSTQNVFNPDYLVGAIPCVVIIDPAGKVRHLGLNPHTPGVDIAGKITAILKEFNLPVPEL